MKLTIFWQEKRRLVINYSNKVSHKMGKFIETSFYMANFLEFNICAHQYVVK